MNRRKALKSILCTGALSPLISNFTPLHAAPTTKPNKVSAKKNLVIIPVPLGFFGDEFLPKGDDLNSSNYIKILKDHHNDITVMKEISQPEIGRGHGNSRGLLTLNRKQKNGQYISLDQFARERIIQASRYRSVNMGKNPMVWDKNSRSAQTLYEAGPEVIYKKLFSKESSIKDLEHKIKLLQIQKKNYSFNAKTAAGYRVAISELEEEIATDIEWASKPIPELEEEFDYKVHFTDNHARGYIYPFEQHLGLVHLGLKYKRGQIFVASPPFLDKTALGVNGSYHNLGHRARQFKVKYDDMVKLESHLFNCFNGFLNSLKKSKLLDDTIVMFMGNFSDPGGHSRNYSPMLIAGGGFKHKGSVECKDKGAIKYQMADLYTTVLRQMGIDVEEFASFKGNMDNILL